MFAALHAHPKPKQFLVEKQLVQYNIYLNNSYAMLNVSQGRC